jgi:ankyrin repeat protein
MRNLATVVMAAGSMVASAAIGRADPIHDAVLTGDAAEVKRLLQGEPALANVPHMERTKHVGYTPLHYAAGWGRKDVVEVLLAYQADVNAKKHVGETPFEMAVRKGHKEVAQLLLAKGANLDIFTAAGLGMVGRVESFLKADEKSIRATRFGGETPLHWAAGTGQEPVVELLLARKADINAQGPWERTPLHYAAVRGHKGVVAALLRHKAKIEATDMWGSTPLHAAAWGGHQDVVKLLLESKANVNARKDRVVKPGWAISMDAGDPKPFDPMMSTPLHEAASLGHKEVVEILLASKADVNAKDKYGDTPLRMAMRYGHKDVAKILRRCGGRE